MMRLGSSSLAGSGLGTDAVGLLREDAVAAVDAAAHDEVDGHGRLAVRRLAQHDPTAGIGIARSSRVRQVVFIS